MSMAQQTEEQRQMLKRIRDRWTEKKTEERKDDVAKSDG